MPNIYVTSDTHFGHTNMLRFTNPDGSLVRPGFRDVSHMDEVIIERWNEVVRPEDKIYHLGDVGFNLEHLQGILPRLNGHKRLIIGNHDLLDMGFYAKYFKRIQAWRQFVDKDRNCAIICSHFPLHESSFLGRYAGRCINVHGHIHARVIDDPRYINVCVERTDYRPVLLEKLLDRASCLG